MCKIINNKQKMAFRDLGSYALWEIFRKMSKFELAKMADMCPEFAEIIGNTRLWRNVYIEYKYTGAPTAFEELFTGPCPIRKMSFRDRQINPPVTTEIQQVEVMQLDFNMGTIKSTGIQALQALAEKYPCKELILDFIDLKEHLILLITEAVAKQDKFEILSLRDVRRAQQSRQKVLKHILNTCCSNLKVLNLSQTILFRDELSTALKNAPSSLEKMGLYNSRLEDTDLAMLAESCPNLRELELEGRFVKHPSLAKFHSLESLHIDLYLVKNLTWLQRRLIKLPKLKSVHILGFDQKKENIRSLSEAREELRIFQKDFSLIADKQVIQDRTEKLRLLMKPHNIEVYMECVTVLYDDWEEPAWFKYKKCSIRGLGAEPPTGWLTWPYVHHFNPYFP